MLNELVVISSGARRFNIHFLTVRDTTDKRAETGVKRGRAFTIIARSAIIHDRHPYEGFPNLATLRDYQSPQSKNS